MMYIKNIILLLLIVFTISCRKDAPPTLPQQGSINLSTGKRLLICDEGNYGQNNAAVSIYSPINNAVIISAFQAANPKDTLGDVVQSISKIDGNYYLVVNNSGTIVVCNGNFVRIKTISGFTSPRYMQYVYNGKAYVSNLQLNNSLPNYIQIVDILTNTITKTIRLDGWTEGMQLANGNVYVCNQSKNYVYVINTQTDALTDSIYVGATSNFVVKDENGKLWVSCNSDSTASIHIPASLVRINPANDSIEATISLQTIDNAISRLCINGAGNTLYYLMTNVYKMSITATACPSSPIIQQGNYTFYGLCIDPDDESIYVSDALNYNSNGKLYHYQSSTLMGTYMVGVNPGFMMMDE
jgi:YVTN family beta-propeller protein